MVEPDLKSTFNSAAYLYEEMRPGYPAELIQDIVDLSEIPDQGNILEIGCGTGQATRSFAIRGYQMLCLDRGANLIEVAEQRFEKFSNISFVQSTFEDWRADRVFDIVISATAFHWIKPKVRYIRVRDALKSRGSLAVFSNRHVRKSEGFFAEVQKIYEKYYQPSKSRKMTPDESECPEPGIDAFSDPIWRKYPWSQTYTAEDYIRLLGTYSDHIALPEDNRERLFEGISNLINTRYEGTITKYYEAVLDFRKKIS